MVLDAMSDPSEPSDEKLIEIQVGPRSDTLGYGKRNRVGPNQCRCLVYKGMLGYLWLPLGGEGCYSPSLSINCTYSHQQWFCPKKVHVSLTSYFARTFAGS